MIKNLIILLISCFQVIGSAAQPAQINIRKVENTGGLVTSNITHLLQDSKGFLWVISVNKIQRYDGKYTRVFYIHEQDNAPVIGIAESRSGNIWIATSKHLYKYKNEYAGFKEFAGTTGGAGRQLNMIQNEYNDVFILCRNGILTIDERSSTLKKIPPSLLIDNSSYHPFCSYKNSLFFSNGKTIYRYQGPKMQLDSIHFETARQMIVLNEDSIWVGSTKLESSLVSFSARSVVPVTAKQFDKTFPGDAVFISEGFALSSNCFFTIIRYKGCYIYNSRDNSFTEVKVYEEGAELTNFEVMTNVAHKTEKGVFFLLLTKALYYIIPENKSFSFFNPAWEGSSGEISSTIRSFAEDKYDNIWASTNNGFLKWDRLTNQVKNYYPKTGAKDYLNFSSVRAIAANKDKLLIGQSEGGLWVFDPATEKFSKPLYPSGSYGDSVRHWTENDFITSVTPLKNGDFLVASNKHIKQINGQSNSVSIVEFKGIKNIKLPRVIYEDRQGRLWFLGADGIFVTDSAFRLLYHITDPALNSSFLNTIVQVSDSVFWIGWEGLWEVTVTKHDSLAMQPVFDHIGNRIIYNLYKDASGYLWATCDVGIYRLQTDKRSYRLYDEENNVLNKQYTYGAAFPGRDGHVYLPGYNGITYFAPEKFSGAEDSVYTTITSVKINRDDSLFFSGPLKDLSYKQNSIEINYIAPYIYNGNKVLYRYFLEGVDKDWVSTGNNTFVRFSSLQEGNYRFRVAASLNGKDWFETTAPFIFTIKPPFWKTWWFRALLLLFVIGLIVFFVRKKINTIKTGAAVKQEMTELEVKALRAQMNPHFIFNAMNSIQQFTLKNDVDNANLYISKFSTLLRKVLHTSQQNFITLEEETEQLNLYLEIEKLRLGDEFIYHIKMDDEIEADAVKIPGMLVQPFVENALKHGLSLKEGVKKLEINFQLVNSNELLVTITDNGIGRLKAQQVKEQQEKLLPHQSKGVELVQERLRLFSHAANDNSINFEDLLDDQGIPAGTKVSMRLPLSLF